LLSYYICRCVREEFPRHSVISSLLSRKFHIIELRINSNSLSSSCLEFFLRTISAAVGNTMLCARPNAEQSIRLSGNNVLLVAYPFMVVLGKNLFENNKLKKGKLFLVRSSCYERF
jgi:hypothetical protein